jgi:hypothetical protein
VNVVIVAYAGLAQRFGVPNEGFHDVKFVFLHGNRVVVVVHDHGAALDQRDLVVVNHAVRHVKIGGRTGGKVDEPHQRRDLVVFDFDDLTFEHKIPPPNSIP